MSITENTTEPTFAERLASLEAKNTNGKYNKAIADLKKLLNQTTNINKEKPEVTIKTTTSVVRPIVLTCKICKNEVGKFNTAAEAQTHAKAHRDRGGKCEVCFVENVKTEIKQAGTFPVKCRNRNCNFVKVGTRAELAGWNYCDDCKTNNTQHSNTSGYLKLVKILESMESMTAEQKKTVRNIITKLPVVKESTKQF